MIKAELPSSLVGRLRKSDRRIVITGAGGWIGLALLELLDQALGASFDSRVRCFGSSDRALRLRNGKQVRQRPLPALADLSSAPTLLFHLAFLTKDKAQGMSHDAYVAANRALSKTVTEQLDRVGVQSAFVASSGAASLAADPSRAAPLRLYGELKREEEELFASWAARTGKTALICRIFNLSGPYINKHQNYALASFILDALAGRPIEVKAPRRVVRGYVSIRDVVALGLHYLLEDQGHGVVRIATGGEALELADVASVVAELTGRTQVNRAPITDPQEDIYIGDDAGWTRMLEDAHIDPTPLTEQVLSTARFLAGESFSPAPDSGVVSSASP